MLTISADFSSFFIALLYSSQKKNSLTTNYTLDTTKNNRFIHSFLKWSLFLFYFRKICSSWCLARLCNTHDPIFISHSSYYSHLFCSTFFFLLLNSRPQQTSCWGKRIGCHIAWYSIKQCRTINQKKKPNRTQKKS